MPESSVPSWLDPSMWFPMEVPCLDLWEKGETLSEEEADEPHIVDEEPEEPQP